MFDQAEGKSPARMTQAGALAPPQRAAVLAGVVAAHVAFLLLVFAKVFAADPVEPKPGPFTLLALQNYPSEPSRPPPPPRMPNKVADEIPRAAVLPTASEPDSGLEAPAAGCDVLTALSKSLIKDPLAVTSVRNAPPETRSIVHAVVIWNAGWTPAAGAPDTPLGPARAVVERSIATLDERCLEEVVIGPRLVPVPDGPRTMFLVFGSGHWKWRDIALKSDAAQGADSKLLPIPEQLWDWL
jgi:hypothetical protein